MAWLTDEWEHLKSGMLTCVADWNGTELDGLVLHSGRLTLRPWQPSDVPAVVAVMADDRMGRCLTLPDPYGHAEAVDFVTGLAAAGRAAGTSLDCAIAENTTGTLLGSISLHLPRGERPVAEIGYWLGTAHWGQGYVTEAVQTLTRFGFAHELSRIRIVCDPANVASAKVALRAGYAYEGVARGEIARAEGHADVAVFGRTAADPGTAIAPGWPVLTELSDGTVLLRPVTPADWPTVLAEAINPESLAWDFARPPMTEAAARSRCGRAGLDWLIGTDAHLLICDAATGAGAGILTLRREGPPDVFGIGYGVLPEFRGRRFTTRALRLVAGWAFAETGAARLELGCKVGNVASARSAEAAGFTADARFRGRLQNPDGTYSDEIGYGLTRPA